MQLVYITLEGTMRGDAWGSILGDDTADLEIPFRQDFLMPNSDKRSPWAEYWQDVRDALDSVTSCGDLIGGRGDVIEARLTFHRAGEGRTATRTYELRPTPAIADFFADGIAA